MKPLLISSGEPAGVGPDLCLALAGSEIPVVIYGDRNVLEKRARQLGKPIVFDEYQPGKLPSRALNHLTILSASCEVEVVMGQLNALNSSYVMNMLKDATKRCLNQEFSALVTAPVHKAIINEAGIEFTGHTEFLAQCCGVEQVVMVLASALMKVALVTTHVPLCDVPKLITEELLSAVILKVHQALQENFGIPYPKLYVAGLNPHAGESGYLGREEIEVITPTINALKQQGLHIKGPLPADTLFTTSYLQDADAFITMYHDQGLPVLKYASFSDAVNVTIGLPIIRTSVDHGTALDLAGSGLANPSSLFAAVNMAANMVKKRHGKN